jgi:hypothetical protein
VYELLPGTVRWEANCTQHATISKDPTRLELTYTLIRRIAAALHARDRLHVTLLRPQDNDTADEVVADHDQINLLLMAALSNAARVVHDVLGLDGSPTKAGWQYERWVDKVKNGDLDLANLVGGDVRGKHLLTILGSLRNTIHHRILSTIGVHDSGRPQDTLLSLPRPGRGQKGDRIAEAIRKLGGTAEWGLVDEYQSRDDPTPYARPNRFVERLLAKALQHCNFSMHCLRRHR